MLNFKSIQLSDKQIVTEIIKENKYRSSDFCFNNLFAWATRFRPKILIIENTFFLKSQCSETQYCYMFPYGQMTLENSINRILEDAKYYNVNFRMIGITTEMWNELNNVFPNKFQYFPERNNFEYIYLSENLINLNGKKLQCKRNHINRFKKENSDWSYSRITTKENVNDCKKMLHEWELTEQNRLEKSQKDEFIAIMRLLDNFEILNLKIGAIYSKNKIIAFSIGEKLTDDTFLVHCEKAFSKINGAYSIINQEFIKHEAVNFKYINREEDMGIENIRKAKMSYIPQLFIEKGFVELYF